MPVDFHTHILPGIDDGSRNTEESIALLKMEKEQGIKTVIATPHFYPHEDTPQRFLSRRQKAYEKLMEAISEEDGLPQIIMGAEVYYFKGISEWSDLKDLAIQGTDYLLLEMPLGKWSDSMFEDIEGIYTKQGLVPIIAHLDRYIDFFNTNKIIKRLENMPVIVQANGNFFVNKKTRAKALKLLKKSGINIIGSDCHNITVRKPNLGLVAEIIKDQLGEEYINRINLTEKEILSDLYITL